MSIEKPYKRIFRPTLSEFGYSNYLKEDAKKNRSLIRSYKILERDLISLLDYVEPSNSNQHVYSHRIYELFLRACTEFETNAKAILIANEYVKSHYNIKDYYKLDKAMKLSEYEVGISIWENDHKLIAPFVQWKEGHTLTWYQDYNDVKHHRNSEFSKANLYNLFLAVASVQLILFCQFHMHSFYEFDDGFGAIVNDDCISGLNSIFILKFTGTWEDEEKYCSNIGPLKLSNIEFDNFGF